MALMEAHRPKDERLDGLLYSVRNDAGVSYQSALLRKARSIKEMQLLWDHGIPADYASACLSGGTSTERIIECWREGVPSELACAV